MRPHGLLPAGAIGLTLALAVSCSEAPPSPPPPAPPAPAPTPPPSPPPPEPEVEWQAADLTPGTWIYRDDDRGSVALYGEAGGDALFVVRCDMADRRIHVSRAGRASGNATMAFAATHGARSYPAQSAAGEHAYLVATTTARDAYLDTLAYSRGRFAVSVTGQPRLVLPNWPEMIRVVEDCRG